MVCHTVVRSFVTRYFREQSTSSKVVSNCRRAYDEQHKLITLKTLNILVGKCSVIAFVQVITCTSLASGNTSEC